MKLVATLLLCLPAVLYGQPVDLRIDDAGRDTAVHGIIAGSVAYPATAVEALGGRFLPDAAGGRIVLFGDTIRVYATSPVLHLRGRLDQLAFPVTRHAGALYLPEQFFIEWLPKRHPERVRYAAGVLHGRAPALASVVRTELPPPRPRPAEDIPVAATADREEAPPRRTPSGTGAAAPPAVPDSDRAGPPAAATTQSPPPAGRTTPPAESSPARTTPPTESPPARTTPPAESPPANAQPAPPRDVTRVVVIDAGHGGRDPGKIGPNGLREKDVTLQLATQLADILADRGYEVRLTRASDTLVALADRPRLANEWKDGRPSALFLSIHANSVARGDAQGFETFFLADARTEDERRVAQMENSAIAFEDVPDDHGSELDQILSGLRNDFYVRASGELAEHVQNELATFHTGPNRGVKRAGFHVLVGALMPAVLVEVGFISNPEEATLLGTSAFQQKLVQGMAGAVDRFFESNEHLLTAGTR